MALQSGNDVGVRVCMSLTTKSKHMMKYIKKGYGSFPPKTVSEKKSRYSLYIYIYHFGSWMKPTHTGRREKEATRGRQRTRQPVHKVPGPGAAPAGPRRSLSCSVSITFLWPTAAATQSQVCAGVVAGCELVKKENLRQYLSQEETYVQLKMHDSNTKKKSLEWGMVWRLRKAANEGKHTSTDTTYTVFSFGLSVICTPGSWHPGIPLLHRGKVWHSQMPIFLHMPFQREAGYITVWFTGRAVCHVTTYG